MAPNVDEATLPEHGVWRVGLAPDPYFLDSLLSADELNNPRVGNRFDSPLANYGVLYFGTTLAVCFGETLSRLRPDLAVAQIVSEDWAEEGFLPPGEVAADWRHQRLAVRVCCAEENAIFVDVESAATRWALSKHFASMLATLEISEIDVSVIRGGDRRITRMVSLWAWSQQNEDGTPKYAGVRYLSRLDTEWECWALFDRVPTRELERRGIVLEMTELHQIAELWGLRVF